MSIYVDTQIKLTERESATDYPLLSKTWLDFDWVIEESTGLALFKILTGAGPTTLDMGSIAKGRILVLVVEEDETNGREPLEIRINGSGNDAWTGLTYVYEADATTGITSVHVTNPGSNTVTYRWYIAGDIA